MSDTAAASSSTPEKPRGSKRGRSHKTKASGPPKEEEEETVDVEPPKRKEEEEEDEPEAKRPALDTSSSPPPPPPSPKAEAVPVAAPPAAAAVAPGKEEEVAKPVAVAKKAGKKPEAVDKTISSVERDFRRLFSREAGYRFWASDLNLKHVTVRLSKVSDKKMAEYRAKAGRALKNMKDRYVNVNSLFSTIPPDEEILSKFVPDLVEKARTEPFRVIQLSPPCKAKWVRLQGLGNFDKPKFPPDNEKDAGHELSLTAGAYDEARVDDNGCDPSAFAWMQHVDKMWQQQIAHEIASNKEIAPDLHKNCAEKMEKLVADRPLADGEKYEERYLAYFKDTYIKKRGLEQKFVYKMFRYPTAEEQEMFRSEPYKAPSDRLQQVYDDAGPKDKLVYNDFPVVRPKTKEEAEASFATDPNPFVAVPFEQRGEIRDNSICSVLYEVGVTESAKDKSHLKLRPLLLIWIRDVAKKPAVKKEKKPFVFSSVEVSEDMVEDSPILAAIPRDAPVTIEQLRAMFPDNKKVDEEVKALLDEGFIFASINENTYQRT